MAEPPKEIPPSRRRFDSGGNAARFRPTCYVTASPLQRPSKNRGSRIFSGQRSSLTLDFARSTGESVLRRATRPLILGGLVQELDQGKELNVVGED